MSNEDGPDERSISFEVGPEVREVRDAAVEAFDSALAAAGNGEVMRFMDPQRINAFSSGGPPVWSVAAVPIDAPVGNSTLYLTYGLSEAMDPSRAGANFELSIAVAGEATMWPALVLRALARYMLQSQRELLPGQFMPFPAPITKFFAPPNEREEHPATEMSAAYFLKDPALRSISTPSGDVEVRRVVGMYPDELEMIEPWSIEGWIELMASRDPDFVTDIARASHADDAEIAERIERGAREDGSDFPHVAVDGVAWVQKRDGELRVGLPGGRDARRIHRMLQARLPFGRALLVHDTDPENQLAVAFQPSDSPSAALDDEVLVLSLPAEHPLIGSLNTDEETPITWTLG